MDPQARVKPSQTTAFQSPASPAPVARPLPLPPDPEGTRRPPGRLEDPEHPADPEGALVWPQQVWATLGPTLHAQVRRALVHVTQEVVLEPSER
jgi:hypothetical protein